MSFILGIFVVMEHTIMSVYRVPPFPSFHSCEHEFAYRKHNGTNIDLLVLEVDELQTGHFIGFSTIFK